MNVYVRPYSDPFLALATGKSVSEPATLPLEYHMRVDESEEEPAPAPRMYAFFPNVCLMSTRLIQTLTSAGVDNLQLFPARIIDPTTDATNDDYFAVNVVGLVECADMARSDHSPLADLFYFHKLVITPEKARGLLLFRLAESPIDIIVHERVAQAIRNANFPEIVLERVTPD